MPLKFNPFTGTLDYVSAIAEILKAKAPLKITGEEIELEEAEFVKKVPEQTISGKKVFQTPVPAESEGGTAATNPVTVKGTKGGKATGTLTRKGGTGSGLEWETGSGGEVTGATVTGTGGNGGTFKFLLGAGEKANLGGAVNNTGGNGSLFEILGAEGAVGGGVTSGNNIGGNGTRWTFKAGKGGNASSSTKSNKAGAGGKFIWEGEPGGTATGPGAEGTCTGGKGSDCIWQAGEGGGATGGAVNTPGKAGEFAFELHHEGGNETVWSVFQVNTKSGLRRFYIHPEGNIAIGNTVTPKQKLEVLGGVKAEKGVGNWNKEPPAAQPAEIKPEEITVKALMEKLNTLNKEYGLTA